MQVNTNIDEADVARIKTEMKATFTVDAYSGEIFAGILSQICLAAFIVQNVVTYNAIIDVPNPELRLKPGMTANVKILIQKVEDVLMLPNSALRFKPSLSDLEMEAAYQRAGEAEYYNFVKSIASSSRAAKGGTLRGESVPVALSVASGSIGARRSSSGDGGSGPAKDSANLLGRKTVWVLGADNLLRPAMVTLGLTDGAYSQIVDGKLKQGDKVITGLAADRSATRTVTTNAPGLGMPGMGGGPPPPR